MNFLPAERSEAAICFTSNQGWLFSARTNSCPTAPVTPIIATRFMQKYSLHSINIPLALTKTH
jgi:hypothetical protein